MTRTAPHGPRTVGPSSRPRCAAPASRGATCGLCSAASLTPPYPARRTRPGSASARLQPVVPSSGLSGVCHAHTSPSPVCPTRPGRRGRPRPPTPPSARPRGPARAQRAGALLRGRPAVLVSGRSGTGIAVGFRAARPLGVCGVRPGVVGVAVGPRGGTARAVAGQRGTPETCP